ncbi:MAG: hypothetical protein R3B72_32595 [Polyangiaceae bacterium]
MRPLALCLAFALPTGVWACTWTSADDRDASDVTRARALGDVPPSAARELAIEPLLGRWYVVLSSYDFWRGRSDTTIDYAIIPGPAGTAPDLLKLRDEVGYRDEGEPDAIVGVDIQDPTLSGHFQWRGDGLLHLIVSHWYVVARDPKGAWLVTYFADSNLGTGAGLDVYARRPCLSPEREAEALAAIFDDPWLAPRARGIFRIPHAGARACQRGEPSGGEAAGVHVPGDDVRAVAGADPGRGRR